MSVAFSNKWAILIGPTEYIARQETGLLRQRHQGRRRCASRYPRVSRCEYFRVRRRAPLLGHARGHHSRGLGFPPKSASPAGQSAAVLFFRSRHTHDQGLFAPGGREPEQPEEYRHRGGGARGAAHEHGLQERRDVHRRLPSRANPRGEKHRRDVRRDKGHRREEGCAQLLFV